MLPTSWRRLLLAGTALLAVPAVAQLPEGGVVVGGSAAITSGGGSTVVVQGSDRAAIDWRSFNVGRDQRVEFRQPSAASWTLNRVTGPSPSTIAGRVTANGGIVLVNQSGIVFTGTAQVDAAGLIATTANIANGDFMAGRMRFDQASARPDARVENHGTITIRESGLAALVAPRVVNAGAIRAPLGRVMLAGAETFTVDLHGDGLLSLEVTGAVRTRPMGEDGAPVTELVTNTGTVVAEGGSVVLTAAALDGIVQDLVTAGGTLSAPTAGARTGTVAIAGRGGAVRVTGTLAATGEAPGTMGGRIEVLADRRVTLAAGSRVDAGGRAGGGGVGIGTTRQGAVPVAERVTIAPGATVAANALAAGRGGTVIVNSRLSTVHAGTITATAGPAGGDGGFVEVSGQGGLRLGGRVDVSAPLGTAGTILIDPLDINIVAGGTGGGSLGKGDPALPFDVPDGSTSLDIDPADIAALTGNIRLQATRNITLSTSLDVSGEARSFTLEAGGNIVVNAGVTLTVNGNIGLYAGTAGIPGSAPTAAMQIDGTLTASGSVLLSSATTLNVTGAVNGPTDIAIIAGGDMIVTGSLTTGGGLVLQGGTLALGSATVSAGAVGIVSAGAVDLSNPANSIAAIGSVNASSLVLATSGTIGLVGPVSVVDLTVSSGGAIGLGGPVSATGAANLSAFGTIVQSGGTLTTGTLTVSGSAIDLRGSNSIGTLISASATGDVIIAQAPGTALTISGPVAAGTGALLGVRADAIAFVSEGELSAPGGRLALAPSTAGTDMLIGGSGPGVLFLDTATLINAGAAAIELGSIPGVVGASAGAVRFAAPLDLGSGTLTLGATGAVTQDAGAAIAAGAVNGAAGTLAFADPGNAIAALGPFAAGAGGIDLVSSISVDVAGAVGSSGRVRIEAGPSLGLAAPITAPGQTVRLASGSTLFQLAAAPVTAAELDIASGFINMPAPNAVQRLAGLVNNDGGTLATAGALDITGVVDASQLTLDVGGALTQSGAGVVRVGFGLGGTAGSVALTSSANEIAVLDAFAASAGGLAITSSVPLQVNGALTAPFADGVVLSLQADSITFGPAGSAAANTVRYAPLTAGQAISVGKDTGGLNVTQEMLDRTGAVFLEVGVAPNGASTLSPITLNGILTLGTNVGFFVLDGASVAQPTGALTAQLIRATAHSGDVTMLQPNSVPILSQLAAPQGSVSYRSAVGVIVGTIDAGADALLDVAGAIDLRNAIVVPGTFTLTATGTIAQDGTVPITVGTLVASGAALDFGSDNLITTLGALTTAGDIVVVNAQALAVAGPVAGASLALDVSGDVTFSGNVTLGGVLDVAAAAVSQPAGTITASRVTGSADSLSLDRPGNAISALGPFTAGAGGIMLVTGSALNVTDGPATSVGAVTLAAGGAITLDQPLSAAGQVVSLAAGGTVLQADGAVVTAAELRVSGTLVQLREANVVGRLGTSASTAGIALTTTQDLIIVGAVTGPSLILDSAGTVTQAGAGVVLANRLEVSGTGITLDSAGNAFGVLGTSTAATGGATFVTSAPLILDGTIDVPFLTDQLLAIQADRITATAFGRLIGNTVRLAPLTAGTAISVGTDTGGLNVATSLLATSGAVRFEIGRTPDGSATGSPITLGGAIDVEPQIGTLVLDGASVIQISGTLRVDPLEVFASTGDIALLQPGNAITQLSQAIALQGSVAIRTDVALLAGMVEARHDVTLQVAGALDMRNRVVAGGTASLLATGDVVQGDPTFATLAASVLNLSGAAITLTQASNDVAALGSVLASGGVSLTTARDLDVIGPVSAAFLILDVTGDLAFRGAVSLAGALSLTAGTVTQPTGTIAAAALSGTATALTLDQPGNAIFGLGPLTVSGGDVVLSTAAPLSVTGAVATGSGTILIAADAMEIVAGGSLAAAPLVALAPLTLGRAVLLGAESPAAMSLTQAELTRISSAILRIGGRTAGAPSAGTITVGGASDVRAGTDRLELIAAQGIGQTVGGLGADVLGGVAGLDIFLGAGGNTISVIEGMTAGLQLRVASGSPLTVSGAVAGTAAEFSALGALLLDGVTAGTTLTGSAIGDLTLAGLVSSGGQATLNATGTVGQQDGSLLLAGALGGTAGTVRLPNANRIGVLDGLSVGGVVELTNAQPLTVAGLSAASATLNVQGSLAFTGGISIGGALTLQPTGGVTQPSGTIAAGVLTGSATGVDLSQPNAVGVLGAFISAGGFRLDNAGGLTVAGPLSATQITLRSRQGGIALNGATTSGGQLRLDAAGTVTDGAGSVLTAASLAGTVGDLVLDDDVRIGTLADLAASGALVLRTAGPLTVAGPLIAGTAILTVPGQLSFAGSVTAQAIAIQAAGPVIQAAGVIDTASFSGSGGATFLTGANRITGLDGYTANSPFVLTTVGDLVIRRPLTADDVVLNVGGALTQAPAGVIVAGTLAGSAGSAALDAGNQIVRLLGFSTSGDFILVNARSLDLSGNLSAGNATLTVGGDLSQSGGIIRTGVLSGSSAGNTDLNAANCVGTLGPFAVGDRLTFTNGQPLVVQGSIAARQLAVNAVGTITLRGNLATDDASFTSATGSCAACTGIAGDVCPAGFEQDGVSVVEPIGPGPYTLLIDTSEGNGDIVFGGLDATRHAITLDAGDGRIEGQINAGRLLIVIGGGAADLFGTVGGLSGAIAAAAANTDPVPDIRFRLNSCPIGTVNCTQLPFLQEPLANPLTSVRVEVGRDRDRDPDVVLPGVAAQDF